MSTTNQGNRIPNPLSPDHASAGQSSIDVSPAHPGTPTAHTRPPVPSSPPALTKPEIAFGDFEKLDIRIGTIVKAEEIPESMRLIRLQIDFGEFQRTVLAGIKGMVNVPQLPGKQVPVLVNLAPRRMMNENSQGMILAADDGGKAVLLHPETPTRSGEKVR
jgi:methionyl-tRNA synthetase